MIVVFSLFLLILGSSNAWKQDAEEIVKTKSASWLEWLSVLFYKTFYIALITAIFACTFYHFVKNKSVGKGWASEIRKDDDNYSKVFTLTESSVVSSVNIVDTDDEPDQSVFSESENQLRQRLKQTQEEILNLRKQLTITMDNKTELESSLALIDKEKTSVELQLDLDRVEDLVELEKLKNNNTAAKREIQKLLEEKEFAEKEVLRLDRDARISRSANMDAEFLVDRLESVKKEADSLKQQFNQLTKEKVKASTVLSEKALQLTQGNLDMECCGSWSAPDLAREFMTLD